MAMPFLGLKQYPISFFGLDQFIWKSYNSKRPIVYKRIRVSRLVAGAFRPVGIREGG
jgi:hypothetical protein